MKKIACEICGSPDLIKSGDFFECQSCGMKYKSDDIKKMMIEGTVEVTGTVKIDSKEEIEKAYASARSAQEIGDNELALKHYEEVFSSVPDDWEVLYYIMYNKAVIQAKPVAWDDRQKRIRGMEQLNEQYQKSIPKLIKLVEENSTLEDLELLARRTVDYSVVVFNAITDFFIDKVNNDFSTNYCVNAVNTVMILLKEIEFKHKKSHSHVITYLEGQASSMFKNALTYKRFMTIETALRREISMRLQKSSGSSDGNISNSGAVGKDACYIATAIYGSYDCPEVWTLRRYRDNNLSKNKFGRLFIKLYYKLSPPFIKIFGKTRWFNNNIKKRLDKKVEKLQNKGIESTPYSDKEY